MIDAVWLLWSRARVDYVKAATACLLTRCIAGARAEFGQPEALSTMPSQK
jgi:hypothetical protein